MLSGALGRAGCLARGRLCRRYILGGGGIDHGASMLRWGSTDLSRVTGLYSDDFLCVGVVGSQDLMINGAGNDGGNGSREE